MKHPYRWKHDSHMRIWEKGELRVSDKFLSQSDPALLNRPFKKRKSVMRLMASLGLLTLFVYGCAPPVSGGNATSTRISGTRTVVRTTTPCRTTTPTKTITPTFTATASSTPTPSATTVTTASPTFTPTPTPTRTSTSTRTATPTIPQDQATPSPSPTTTPSTPPISTPRLRGPETGSGGCR